MKNKKKIFSLLGFILIVFLIGYFYFNNKKEDKGLESDNNFSYEVEGILPKYEEKQISREDSYTKASFSYPSFTSFSNKKTEKIINEKIYSHAKNIFDEFFTSAPQELFGGGEKNQKEDFFVVYPVTDGVLSLVFSHWEYVSGAAHGNPYSSSLVFDVDSGEVLELQHFFKEGSSYLSQISEQSRKILKEKLEAQEFDMYDKDWVESGTEPTPENFKTFAVKDDSFVFYFDQYSVAPYAAGAFEVEVSKEDLKSYLK